MSVEKKGNKTMLTELSAARLVEMLQNAAAAQGLSLEDCTVWIRANHRENDYDSEEQVEISCGECGQMTINLLEDWMVEEN
jgi:hypothetical protein